MANKWREIANIEEGYLGPAIALIQKTSLGYNSLSPEGVQRKMRPASGDSAGLFSLRVFSFADDADIANLEDPLATAFFFLRIKHLQSGTNKDRAYCLTFGTKPDGAVAGWDKGALRTALKAICARMRVQAGGLAKLEIMYSPPAPSFKDPLGIAAAMFKDVTAGNAVPPKLEPLENIDVEKPWAESKIALMRWNIKEQ